MNNLRLLRVNSSRNYNRFINLSVWYFWRVLWTLPWRGSDRETEQERPRTLVRITLRNWRIFTKSFGKNWPVKCQRNIWLQLKLIIWLLKRFMMSVSKGFRIFWMYTSIRLPINELYLFTDYILLLIFLYKCNK